MKEKHRIAPDPAAFSFTLALLLIVTALFASSCGESSETRSLKATISAQASQLAEVAPPTVTSVASPTPPAAVVSASPTPPPEPRPHASLTPIWSVKCRGEGKPLVLGDVVVTSTANDYPMGLARATGEKLWEWDVRGTAFAGDQERVYVYASGRIYALDLHTGERVWKIEGPIARPRNLEPDYGFDGYPRGILYLYDGMLYFAMPRNETRDFVAADASSGKEKWIYRFPSIVQIYVTPFPEGLQVRSGSDTVGLDPQTGEVLWGAAEAKREPYRWDVGNVRIRQYEGEAVDLFDGTIIWTWDRAVIGNPIGLWGDVVVFSAVTSLYGISAQDGTELWDLDLQGGHSWGGAVDGIGLISNSAGVHGVDMASGKRIWKVERDLGCGEEEWVLTDIGVVVSCFSSGKGSPVDLIDPATGEVRWMKEFPGWVTSIVDADDLVLIVSGATNLGYTLTAYEKVR